MWPLTVDWERLGEGDGVMLCRLVPTAILYCATGYATVAGAVVLAQLCGQSSLFSGETRKVGAFIAPLVPQNKSTCLKASFLSA